MSAISQRIKSLVIKSANINVAFNFIRPLLRRRLTSIFYHLVSDKVNPLVSRLYRYRDVRTFRNDLDFFQKNFNFVSFDQVVEHVQKGIELPEYPLFLSFDDGHREMYEVVAPILTEKNIPATFFLCTNIIDNMDMIVPHKKSYIADRIAKMDDRGFASARAGLRELLALPRDAGVRQVCDAVTGLHNYDDRDKVDALSKLLDMDWDEILSEMSPYLTKDQVRWLLNQGFTIGSHGLDHTKFSFLDDAQRVNQVEKSVDYLCKNFGMDKIGFSFPNSHKDVSDEWMREMTLKYPAVKIFFSTKKFSNGSDILVNRIGMEEPLDDEFAFADTSLRVKISSAYLTARVNNTL